VSSVYLRLSGLALPDAVRAPLLERMLARAAPRQGGPDWREEAFRSIAPLRAPMPGIAPAALCSEVGPLAAGAVYIASPVHCEAGMVSVRLPADGLLALTAEEAGQLARELNRDLAGSGQHLVAAPSGRLFCVFAAAAEALTCDPLAVCGRDIGRFLPAGTDGSRLRRLMSEIEMWLHEHALNRARADRQSVPITGLWLWGGGRALADLPALEGWTAGTDPLFSAWPVRTSFPAERRSGVVVLADAPGSAAWQATQSAWVAPALAALRAGRVRQVDVSIGEQRFLLRAAWSWRIWRRIRPWWEYLD
jgi:hypothetical protein